MAANILCFDHLDCGRSEQWVFSSTIGIIPEEILADTAISFIFHAVAGGIYQNSIYGIAAKLDYSGAVVLGSVSFYSYVFFQ